MKKQELFLKKRNINFTELIGFEDPFDESSSHLHSISNDQKEYEKHREKVQSLFHERLLFDENMNNITHHEIMNLKPLTKSSSGGYMVQGILLGVENEDIILYDIYKNQLVNMSMAEYGGMKLLKGSNHNEDMYIAAISPNNTLCEFNLGLLNNFKSRKGTNSHRNPKGQLHLINDTKSEETGREDLFNKNYKRMLKLYTYYVESSNCVNLNELLGLTNTDFIHLELYMNRGEKYYILGDEEGYI